MSTPPEQPHASVPVPPFSWPTGRGVPPGPGVPAGPAVPAYGTPSPGTPVYGTPAVPAPERSAAPETPPPLPQQRGRSRGARAGAGAAAGAGGLAKLGGLGKLFGVFKLFFLAAKLKFALSMIVSIGFYAVIWGWRFAVGFVLLMLVHELGHVAELRRQGVRTSLPMFIPFIGAYVAMHDAPKSARHEATSAFAGPLAGTVATTALLYFAQFSGSQLLMALAYTGFFLNLFNLLPVHPLDGGRVAAALHPAVWVAGLAVGAWYLWQSPRFNLILLIVLLFGVKHLVGFWRNRAEKAAYYAVPAQERAYIAAAYVALAGWCAWGMHVAYVVPPR